jgi:NAD+ synthase (glutamine-hydrolysing)
MTKQLRIVMAQLNLLQGSVEENLEKHIQSACIARDELKAHVIVFPELSLTGYPVDDLLLRPSYLDSVDRALQTFIDSVTDIHCIVGHPLRRDNKLFNACSVIYNGNILLTYTKHALPNYAVFDEHRYFSPGDSDHVVMIHDIPVGIVICEDLWVSGPVERAAKQGAKIILSPNASPFDVHKHELRLQTLQKRALSSNIPIIYTNEIGSQDEIIFDGGSMAIDADGTLCQHAGFFQENLLAVDASFSSHHTSLSQHGYQLLTDEQRIYQCLVFGIQNYVHKNKFNGALIGLSGGIDSALTLALAVDALGKENVKAVLMPSRFTAPMSMEDGISLAKNLDISYDIISIEPAFETILKSLEPVLQPKQPDITEENIQARCRGIMLMAISNHTKKIVLTTGNRSEMAVGYCTLYGDMAGGLAVLKDIPKMMVYRLSNYRNTLSNVIPQRIIDRAPSAELAFDQKDENSLPPYPVLDRILELYLNDERSINDIINEGFDDAVVNKVVKLINQNEYKRRQSPVGIRINKKSFGRDRRYPVAIKIDC